MGFLRKLFSRGSEPHVQLGLSKLEKPVQEDRLKVAATPGQIEQPLRKSGSPKTEATPGDIRTPLREFGSKINDAAFVDEKTIIACGPHKVEVFKVDDGMSIRSIDCDGSDLKRIRVASGKLYIAACGDHFAPKGAGGTYDRGEAIIWSDWKRLQLPSFEARVNDMIFLPDGDRVACFSYRHSGGHYINILDILSQRVLSTVNLKVPASSPQLSPNGQRIAFASESYDGYAHEILVFDVGDLNSPVLSLKETGKYLRVRFLNDEQLICLGRMPKPGGLSSEFTGFLHVWDLARGGQISKVLLAPDLVSYWGVFGDADVHPMGSLIAVSVRWSERKVDRSGNRVLIKGGDIGFITRDDWTLTNRFGAHVDNIQHVMFSPDGSLLMSRGPASPDSSDSVRLWQLPGARKDEDQSKGINVPKASPEPSIVARTTTEAIRPGKDTLIEQLTQYSDDDTKLCEVIGKLGNQGDPVAIPHLVRLLYRGGYVSNPPPVPNWLNERYPYIGQRAAIALAQIGTKECVTELIKWSRAKGGGGSGLAEVLLKRLGVAEAGVREATTDWRRMWSIDIDGNVRHQVPQNPDPGTYFHVEFVMEHDKDGYLYFGQCRLLDAASGARVQQLNGSQKAKVAQMLDESRDWRYHWQRSPASVRQMFGR